MAAAAWIVLRDPEALHAGAPDPVDAAARTAWLNLREALGADGWLADPSPDGSFTLIGLEMRRLALGGAAGGDPEDPDQWPSAAACRELLRALADGKLLARGRHRGADRREDIPPDEWRGMAIFYPPGAEHRLAMMLPHDLFPMDEGPWRDINVGRDMVVTLWPALAEEASFRTGAPGRPTGKHLICAEHGRRLTNGEVHDRVSAEARHLKAWYDRKHPTAPPLTQGTIENAIRAAHLQRPAKKAKVINAP